MNDRFFLVVDVLEEHVREENRTSSEAVAFSPRVLRSITSSMAMKSVES